MAAVGCGVALEVGQIAHVWVFVDEKGLSSGELVGHGEHTLVEHGAECLIVTVGATAGAESSVAVGASATGVN